MIRPCCVRERGYDVSQTDYSNKNLTNKTHIGHTDIVASFPILYIIGISGTSHIPWTLQSLPVFHVEFIISRWNPSVATLRGRSVLFMVFLSVQMFPPPTGPFQGGFIRYRQVYHYINPTHGRRWLSEGGSLTSYSIIIPFHLGDGGGELRF